MKRLLFIALLVVFACEDKSESKDCADVEGGTATIDNCEQCVGGTTDAVACNQDCADVWGGTAVVDNCEECVGGTTGVVACNQDCAGIWGGNSSDIDDDGICDWNDGDTYSTIQIGDQLWMAENLKVTHYRDGTPIPTGYSNSEWGDLETGAYAVYDDDESNADTYGYLYNWYAVDTGILAPEGWHVPADEEWMELEMALGMNESEVQVWGYRGTNEGSQLAGNADLWTDGDLENNEAFGTSGFDALPGGYRGNYDSRYDDMGRYGFFRSSTESTNVWIRQLSYNNSKVSRLMGGQTSGFAVRCIRD